MTNTTNEPAGIDLDKPLTGEDLIQYGCIVSASIQEQARADAARTAAVAPADAKDAALDAIATAYGYLWHVNAAYGAPPEAEVLSVTPERAAYEARKALRDLLTSEQRGKGINSVRARLAAMTAAPSSEKGGAK